MGDLSRVVCSRIRAHSSPARVQVEFFSVTDIVPLDYGKDRSTLFCCQNQDGGGSQSQHGGGSTPMPRPTLGQRVSSRLLESAQPNQTQRETLGQRASNIELKQSGGVDVVDIDEGEEKAQENPLHGNAEDSQNQGRGQQNSDETQQLADAKDKPYGLRSKFADYARLLQKQLDGTLVEHKFAGGILHIPYSCWRRRGEFWAVIVSYLVAFLVAVFPGSYRLFWMRGMCPDQRDGLEFHEFCSDWLDEQTDCDSTFKCDVFLHEPSMNKTKCPELNQKLIDAGSLHVIEVFFGGSKICAHIASAVMMLVLFHATHGITKNLFRAYEAYARRRTYATHLTRAVQTLRQGEAKFMYDEEAKFTREFETFTLVSKSDVEEDPLVSEKLLTDVTQWWFLRQYLLRMSDISLTYYSAVVGIIFIVVLIVNIIEIIAIFR